MHRLFCLVFFYRLILIILVPHINTKTLIDLFLDVMPPKTSQPFLAKVPRDLKLNYWVKVITPEGRVVVGKVKYVGLLPGKGEDSFVGVQLSRLDGNSDGSYGGRRFFDWSVF